MSDEVKSAEDRNFRIASDGYEFQIGVKGAEAKTWIKSTEGACAVQHVKDRLNAARETGTFITPEMLERAVQYLETVIDAPNAAAVIAANSIMTQVEALLRSNPGMDEQSVYRYVKRNGKIKVNDDVLRSVVSAIYNAGSNRRSKISILPAPDDVRPTYKGSQDERYMPDYALDVDQILNARPEPERKEPETMDDPVGEPMLPDEDV